MFEKQTVLSKILIKYMRHARNKYKRDIAVSQLIRVFTSCQFEKGNDV